MAFLTKGRLREEIKKLLNGGDIPSAGDTTDGEINVSIGQVCNQLLKTDIFQTNLSMGEVIPNGGVIATYEDIAVSAYTNGKSQATLPAKPLKLPRNMGVWSIFIPEKPDEEFIPLQMGQGALIKSQPMINSLLGQVGYEVFGDKIIFTKDITNGTEEAVVTIRLVIMDISLLDDWDLLPIPPEMEWTIKNEVYKLYAGQPLPDKLVDSTIKSTNIPVKQQQQN